MEKANENITFGFPSISLDDELLKKSFIDNISKFNMSDVSKLFYKIEISPPEILPNNISYESKVENGISTKLFEEIYHSSDSIYIIVTKQGNIIDLNTKAKEILGNNNRFSLINVLLDIFISDDTVNTFKNYINNINDSKGPSQCKLKLVTFGKLPFDVILTSVIDINKEIILFRIEELNEITHKEVSQQNYNELFDIFLENSPIHVFFKDNDVRAIKLSRNFESLLGRPLAEILGKNMDELFPSEMAKSMVKDDLRILEKGEKVVVEEEFNNKYYTTIKYPIYTNGNPTYLAGFTIDITEEKNAREELIENEKQNRIILETALDGFWKVDLHGNILDVNDSYIQMCSYSKQELLSMTISDLEATETNIDTRNHIEKIVKQGKDFFETKHRRKDGTYFDVEICVQYQPDNKKNIFAFIRDITKRKLDEKELLDSKEYYRNIVELAVDGILLGIHDGYIIDANSCFCEMVGKSKEELIGRNISESLFTDEVLNHAPLRYDLLKKGEVVVRERKIIKPNGVEITVEMRTKMLPNKTYQSIYRDITDRINIGKTIINSHQKYFNLIEFAVDGIIIGNIDGIILEVNSSICKMFDKDKEEIVGKHISDFFTKESIKREPLQFDSLLKNEIVVIERSIIKSDGSEIVVEIRTKMMPDKTCQSIIRDITERKQLEEKLKVSQLSLLEAHEMAQIGSWSWELQTDKVECSKTLLSIMDVDEEEFDGTSTLFKNKFHTDDVEYLFKCLNQVHEGVNPAPYEYRIIHKDCTVHNIFAMGRIEFDTSNKPIKYIGAIQDITDRKKTEEQKNTIEQLRQINQYVVKAIEDERLAISRELHDDIGQSLTSLKMDIKMINNLIANNSIESPINSIIRQIDGTIKSVQNLTSTLRPSMLNDLGLVSTVEWYTNEFKSRYKINVILEIDQDISFTKETSLIVFRVIQESLTNVARHSKAIEVVIILGKKNNNINLKIKDNGIGISKDDLYSKKSFGLIIMRERIATLGGTCNIYSNNGSGTNIDIELPLFNNITNENINLR